MDQRTRGNVIALLFSVALPVSNATAQEKQHVSFKGAPESTQYTQQHVIDVGDVPGHQVRLFEIHRTFPTNPPTINGLKLTESWTRATSDYIDNNGSATNYIVYVLENGDKFFARMSLVAQSVGPGKLMNMVVGPITGGTGKLAGIQGIVRSAGTAEPKAGVNENQTDIEYWIAN